MCEFKWMPWRTKDWWPPTIAAFTELCLVINSSHTCTCDATWDATVLESRTLAVGYCQEGPTVKIKMCNIVKLLLSPGMTGPNPFYLPSSLSAGMPPYLLHPPDWKSPPGRHHHPKQTNQPSNFTKTYRLRFYSQSTVPHLRRRCWCMCLARKKQIKSNQASSKSEKRRKFQNKIEAQRCTTMSSFS